MVNIPSAVAPKEPSIWAPIATKAQPNWTWPDKVTTCEENVENLVRPPTKPVLMKSRASGGSSVFSAKERYRRPDDIGAHEIGRERAERERRKDGV